ncbi:putative Adenine nucleotide alpha hydrolases-like superfamily protein [Hibiscus syriacus]|uniref:Adenine nucleotide alpha hydrolases-like superfamily protein n=1 Tax=Hibiscus syriacus TaxID=106335 RepID=A0A6A3A518_HIBSY|nr:putative F-box protein At4g22660 [Hibiscus syriacus]KAE8698335.1 putative Adenine nucleotide alpha hydrolases-like superfamily protein [Hibiscus syriacus]
MTVQATMTKRRKESPLTSRVDEVPAHILRSIFNRLSFNDLVQAKSVCCSWNLLGDELTSKMPWLMLPSKKQVEEDDGINVNNNGYHGFLNLMENRLYSLKMAPKEFRECCCIGSSHGWLVFLQEKAVPFLFNPFKQVRIELPSVDRLLGLENMVRNVDGEFELNYFNVFKGSHRILFRFCGKQQVRECLIQKAILTRKPENNDNGNYGLVLLCNNGEEIAYNASGSDYWTVLDVSHPPYQDILCHRNYLYALSDKNSIEVWELHVGSGHVKKTSDIVFPFPDKSLSKENSLRDVCTCRFYLVESCGDLLFVVRFIGNYVDWDGTLLHEHDLLIEDSNHPKVCPYRTFLFHVYKMDFKELEWVEMDTLDDRALFLGGNQSVSVLARCFLNCEKDCIYFSDDCWERMEEDYLYGGHDMGIYDLKDGSLKPVFEFSSDKIQPPPCWVIPDPAMFES